MDWQIALDLVVAETRHERYRELCHESYPDHLAARALMVRLATGQPAPIAADSPPLPLDEALRLRLLVLACPYRGERIGCGCGELRHCSAYGAGRPWQADYVECQACVAAGRWSSGDDQTD